LVGTNAPAGSADFVALGSASGLKVGLGALVGTNAPAGSADFVALGSASGLKVGLGAFVRTNAPPGSAVGLVLGSASRLRVGLDALTLAEVFPAEGSAGLDGVPDNALVEDTLGPEGLDGFIRLLGAVGSFQTLVVILFAPFGAVLAAGSFTVLTIGAGDGADFAIVFATLAVDTGFNAVLVIRESVAAVLNGVFALPATNFATAPTPLINAPNLFSLISSTII
jgi:hypothetical protein